MPISVPSVSDTGGGVVVRIELAPSLAAYHTGALLMRVYVSTTDPSYGNLIVPLGLALFARNTPIKTAWTTVSLNNDAVGLYHGDVEWEGSYGKGELQAFAYNSTGAEIGSAYAQVFLDRYNA